MKRKSIHLGTILILGIIILTACTSTKQNKQEQEILPAEAEYHKITTEQAKKIIDTEEVIIVDVRMKEEYEEAHIENAILIPNETIDNSKLEELPDLNAKILVYCRSGNRSKQAAKKLVKIGYTNVYDFGGILDWSYATVSEK